MTSKRLPFDTLFVGLAGQDNPFICCPFAIPFSGPASHCNLLEGVPP